MSYWRPASPVNTSVTSLGDRLVGAQSMQASAMIGRHVQIEGKTIEYDGTAAPLDPRGYEHAFDG